MNQHILLRIIFISCSLLASYTALGQNSAISSHFNFDDNMAGDIVINQVRVPDKATLYTYYEALGWWGTGSGYAGIQEHPYNSGKVFIFSIWDHDAHTAPIEEVYVGHGTTTEGFGGEGTGLKSMNFDIGWETDIWYTLLSRAWPVGNHTYYAYWVRDGGDDVWRHLVTMDVAAANSVFTGGNDAFIEDWSDSGQNVRETNLRKGWKRELNGQWYAVSDGDYSVNSWDADPGGRSVNYANNWDGGVGSDSTGAYYYMKCGGSSTSPSTTSGTNFSIARVETSPDFEAGDLESAKISGEDTSELSVSWENVATTLPQFGRIIEIFDNYQLTGTPIISDKEYVPHMRTANVNISSLDTNVNGYYLALSLVDVFDQQSEPTVFFFGAESDRDTDMFNDSDNETNTDSDIDDTNSDSDMNSEPYMDSDDISDTDPHYIEDPDNSATADEGCGCSLVPNKSHSILGLLLS